MKPFAHALGLPRPPSNVDLLQERGLSDTSMCRALENNGYACGKHRGPSLRYQDLCSYSCLASVILYCTPAIVLARSAWMMILTSELFSGSKVVYNEGVHCLSH